MTDLEQFRARPRAANPVPPSFAHLHDPDLLRRLGKTSKSTGKMLPSACCPSCRPRSTRCRTDAMPFLLTAHGRPSRSAAAFGNRFADWVKAAGLAPVKCDDGKVRTLGIHGLRKAACVALAHSGCSAMEIMAVSGHITLSEAQKYVADADQRRMAEAAIAKRAAGSNQHRR
jgi:integrase